MIMSKFHTNGSLEHWEAFLPEMGLTVDTIEAECWAEARQYPRMPDIGYIYTNILLGKITKWIRESYPMFVLDVDTHVKPQDSCIIITTSIVSETTIYNKADLDVLVDRVHKEAFGDLENMLEQMSGETLDSFKVNERAYKRMKAGNFTLKDGDFYGEALLNTIKDVLVNKYQFNEKDITMEAIYGAPSGFIAIKRQTIENYEQLKAYLPV